MLRIWQFLVLAGTQLAITCCLSFIGVGQTSVSQEVVDRYYAKAREICRSTPYRIKTTIDDRVSDDAAWRPYGQSVTEFAGRNSHHKGKHLETITFERKTYIRQRDGSWKEKVPVETRATVRKVGPTVTEWAQVETGTTSNSETVGKTRIPVTKWVQEKADGTFNGSNIVFLVESWFKLEYLSDGLIYEHNNTGRVVFDEVGRYVSIESISFEPKRKIYIRRLEEFEYDENIRIESPIK